MTDKEMALPLGQYINSLLEKIAALEGVFLNTESLIKKVAL